MQFYLRNLEKFLQTFLNLQNSKKKQQQLPEKFHKPSTDMPCSKQRRKRHDLHLLRFFGVTSQEPPKKHLYFSAFVILRLKKPCKDTLQKHMPMQYTHFSEAVKIENIQLKKKRIFFLLLLKTLWVHIRTTVMSTNEYQQFMFWIKNKKSTI